RRAHGIHGDGIPVRVPGVRVHPVIQHVAVVVVLSRSAPNGGNAVPRHGVERLKRLARVAHFIDVAERVIGKRLTSYTATTRAGQPHNVVIAMILWGQWKELQPVADAGSRKSGDEPPRSKLGEARRGDRAEV